MSNKDSIHFYIEKLAIESPELTALIARYGDKYRIDQKALANVLRILAERDEFFMGISLAEFAKAFGTYKMPLVK